MDKRIFFIFMLFFYCSTIYGMGQNDKQGTDRSLLLAFLVKRADEDFFRDQARGFTETCDRLGVQALILDNKMDANITLVNMDIAIENQVDGIALMVPEQRMSALLVNRAFTAHIPIVSIENKLLDHQGRQLAPHFGIPGEEVGYAVGLALAEELISRGWLTNNNYTLGIVSLTNESVAEYEERSNACRRAMLEWLPQLYNEKFFNIHYREADAVGGMLAMQELLSYHPEVTHWVIFAPNEEGIRGAYYALSQLGLENHNICAAIQSASINDDSETLGGDFLSAVMDGYTQGAAAAEALYYNLIEDRPIMGNNPTPYSLQGVKGVTE